VFNLSTPEGRRALRSIIQAVIALAIVGLVGWIVYLLETQSEPLLQICLALLGIVGMGTFFYGAENVTRAIKFKAGPSGIEATVGDDDDCSAK
jgi:hypothetical protein